PAPFGSFAFMHPAPPDIYTLSLHDALPICTLVYLWLKPVARWKLVAAAFAATTCIALPVAVPASAPPVMARPVPLSDAAMVVGRSEEHTSELQSRRDLVCRLLLEKKKKNTQ